MAARGVADDRVTAAPPIPRFSYTLPMIRVFLSAPPNADRADSWVRYAADGRPVARGRDVPSRWPTDATVEVVLAADQLRLAALDLPLMPRSRLRSATQYALEDQMATAAEDSAIAVAQTEARKGVIAAIAADALIRAIAAHSRRIVRVIPESALAPPAEGWVWCASAGGGGFVRRDDGSAFAVGSGNDGELPAELRAALAQAKRAGVAPAVVHAALPGTAGELASWSQAAGLPFVSTPAWHWERATAAAFAAAPDFLEGDPPAATMASGSRAVRWFRPALVLAALALGIHFGALLVQWGWLNLVDWRLSQALVAQATAAGMTSATTPLAASAAIARQNADLRHRASRSAPTDALPLLARAAPSIARLPAGSLKSATYANDAWTIELVKLDAQAVSRVTRALGLVGVDAVSAPIAGGTRMRLTLDATAR